jgi:hypothetical protein
VHGGCRGKLAFLAMLWGEECEREVVEVCGEERVRGWVFIAAQTVGVSTARWRGEEGGGAGSG